MKNKIHIIYIGVILVLGAFSIGLLTKNTSSKVSYINISEVFEKFGLKKELSIQFEKGSLGRDDILNEMYLGLETMLKDIEKNPSEDAILLYKKREAVYMEKREQFDSQKVAQLKEYDAQILRQLNQYVKDYGKEEGVDVILGATGQGNIMYCDEEMNITEEVIAYINERYHGGTSE